MRKRIITERYRPATTGFHFDLEAIRQVVADIRHTSWGQHSPQFMVFAYGVFQYYGKVRNLRDLQPEHYDAVGFAFMEKLIELRKSGPEDRELYAAAPGVYGQPA